MVWIKKIVGFLNGRLLKDLSLTVLLQLFARVFQMLGMFHVANCYGDLNGESNKALVSAQYVQFILTFGSIGAALHPFLPCSQLLKYAKVASLMKPIEKICTFSFFF